MAQPRCPGPHPRHKPFAKRSRRGMPSSQLDPERGIMMATIPGTARLLSVTGGSDAGPVERWRATCYRQDAAATDVVMHGPDWRVEPQPQQMTTRVLRRVAVVESGTRMQDRVVVDEIRFARMKREFEHEFRPLRHRLKRVDDGAFRRAHRSPGRCLAGLDVGAHIARRYLAFDIRIDRDSIRRVRQFARLLLAAPVADIA